MDFHPDSGLERKRILITGAARGIGHSIAQVLVDAGARVVINDLSQETAKTASDVIGALGAVGGDVSSEAGVKSIVDSAVEQLGGLDAVINNAGITEPVVRTTRQRLEDWQKVIDVNLRGVFLMSQEAARQMKEGGAIVNLASVAGLGAMSASNAYGVSKAGVVMMTKTMACDLARFGIRVNAVAPGIIQAPMAEGLFGETKMGMKPFVQRIPMGRLGKPEEIGYAVQFLLSDRASYITGVTLPVDGGWMAFAGAGHASFDGQK